MRRRLLLSMLAVPVAAVVVVGAPAAAVVPDAGDRTLVIVLAVAVVAAVVAAAVVQARFLSRPVEELAEAADRLRSGDPRPIGRRYGVAELDQVADGLDSAGRRVTSLLTAERELAVDASHQLRTPLTALSMRLEEVIA